MPMDSTDSRLLKGLLFFGVLGLIVYYYPFSWPMEGYLEQTRKLEKAKDEIAAMKASYLPYYNNPPPEAFGEDPNPNAIVPPIKPYEISRLQNEYEK